MLTKQTTLSAGELFIRSIALSTFWTTRARLSVYSNLILILLTDMAREAGTAALCDAGISYQDVEAVVASYCYGEPTSGQLMTGTFN